MRTSILSEINDCHEDEDEDDEDFCTSTGGDNGKFPMYQYSPQSKDRSVRAKNTIPTNNQSNNFLTFEE